MAEISLSEYTNKPKPSSSKNVGFPRSGMIIVGAVVLVGVGFLSGMQYQKGKTPTTSVSQTANSQSSSNGSGGPGGYGGGSRGDRAFGTVSAVSSSSITIQGRTGTSTTYNITSSTTVTNDGQSSSVSDIQTGDTVIMTLDSSNTQNVTAIMLNPSFGGGGGYGGGSGTDSSPDNSPDDGSSASGA